MASKKEMEAEIRSLKAANAIYSASIKVYSERLVARQDIVKELQSRNLKLDMELYRVKQELLDVVDGMDLMAEADEEQEFSEFDLDEEEYYGHS